MFRLGTLLGVAAVATTVAPVTRGADATEPIRIEYRAPANAACPSAAQFSAQVFARTASARAATPQETARTFSVELQRHGGRVTGSLVIRETDGATMARRVNGSRCKDVATVLALATALAIDPRAELAPSETLDDPDSAAQTDATSDAAGARTPEAPAAPAGGERGSSGEGTGRAGGTSEPPAVDDQAPGPASVSEHTNAQVEIEEPPEISSGPSIWYPRWAFGATAAFGAAPRPALGLSGLVELRREGVGPAPIGEVGLELAYRQASAAPARDAEVMFRFYVARPTLCASAVVLSTSLRIVPCAVMELGAVTAAGSELPETRKQNKFWATAEVQLRLELALDQAWFMTLDGGAAAPLTRYDFVLENPSTSVHEVPALTATTALRVGRSF